MKKISLILYMVVLLILCQVPAWCDIEEMEIPIVQDSYAETTSPDADYSTEKELRTINARVRRNTYMMFNLSGVNGHITEARLVFNAKTDSDINPGKIRIRRAESNWTDSKLNFNNQPIHTYTVSRPEFIEIYGTDYNRYEIDITALAQRENTQSKCLSLRFEAESGEETLIMSAESGDEKSRPQLVLKVDVGHTPFYDESALYEDEEALLDIVKYAMKDCIAVEAERNVYYENGEVKLLVPDDYKAKAVIRDESLLIPIDTARKIITPDSDSLEKVQIDGIEYVYVKEAAEKAGKVCQWRNGITVIGEAVELSEGLWEKLPGILHAPVAANIITELKNNNPDKKHPRLMATEEDFERIRRLGETDDRVKRWIDRLKQTADTIIEAEPSGYILPNNISMLEMSRQIQSRVEILALMYNITGEEKYAERAWLEIDTALDFPDWNPYHFLDTAELSDGIAIGYDWLYDWLGEERRAKIRDVLRVRTFEEIMKDLSGADVKRYANWATSENYGNWQIVCPGGAITAALAVGDEEGFGDIAGTVLQACIKMLKRSVKSYSPDGGWDEGVGYWSLATKYLVKSLSSLDTAIGNDYGLYDTKGLAATAYFPTFVTGPMGTFNIGDDNVVATVSSPELFWFAKKQNSPWLAYQRRMVTDKSLSNVGVYDLMWYEPDKCSDTLNEIERDKYFGEVEIATMRSRWDDPGAIFVGFHAGDNNSGHCDLDVGTFVLDAFGVRWAEDLGKDDYNLPGYFERTNDRWNYYVKRAEGHNTLLINPGDTKDQMTKAFCKIYKLESKPRGAIALADMTDAYKNNAKSVKRGIMLSDNRSVVTIQDEIELLKESEIWWQMHTRADIEITNNGSCAVLASGGKKLLATLEYPDNASFDVIPASPFSFMPNPEGQKNLDGYRKLAVNLKGAEGSVKIKISFREFDGIKEPDDTTPIGIDEWSVEEGEFNEMPIAYDAVIKNPEDTYSDSASPDNDFSSSSELKVSKSSRFERNAYIKFDISSVGKKADKAEFFFYARQADASSQSASEIRIYKCKSLWEDSMVRFNNAPVATEALSGTDMIPIRVKGSVHTLFSIDVTDYVNEAKARGEEQISFMICGNASVVYVSSNEISAALKPYLEVSGQKYPTEIVSLKHFKNETEVESIEEGVTKSVLNVRLNRPNRQNTTIICAVYNSDTLESVTIIDKAELIKGERAFEVEFDKNMLSDNKGKSIRYYVWSDMTADRPLTNAMIFDRNGAGEVR